LTYLDLTLRLGFAFVVSVLVGRNFDPATSNHVVIGHETDLKIDVRLEEIARLIKNFVNVLPA
jgi:hypothetical protein